MAKEDQELLAASGHPVEPTTLAMDICVKNNQVWKASCVG